MMRQFGFGARTALMFPGEQFGAYLRNEVTQISQLMKSIAFKGN